MALTVKKSATPVISARRPIAQDLRIPTCQQYRVGHDVPVEDGVDDPIEAGALYSVVSAATSIASGALNLTRFTTETTVYLATESTRAIANAILDAVVPVAVNAVVSRVDFNEIVKDHVDVNEIVAQAELTPILDRVPMTEIADYVIEEIDLPSLIRESTGGVADGLLSTLRFQAIQTDNFVSGIVDRVFFRREKRASEREVSVKHDDV